MPNDDSSLCAFTPPPPILNGATGARLPTHAPAATAADPTANALAELAAMAELMVTSLSMGRRGRDGHAVRMRLSLGGRGEVGVSLALHHDDLEVVLTPESATRSDALALASVVERELGVPVSLG